LPNFELKLEIPNIMLVCKFEINCEPRENAYVLLIFFLLNMRFKASIYNQTIYHKIQAKIIHSIKD
jgi:hypothetical protein